MKRLREVIEEKELQLLITTSPGASLVDAARLMALWNVGALLVLDEGRLVGVLSERDYVRAAAMDESLGDKRVEDVMVRSLRVLPADLTTDECMVLMTHLRLRHLPVTDGGELIGLVSVGDLVKDVVGEQSFVIEQLERYITRAANA